MLELIKFYICRSTDQRCAATDYNPLFYSCFCCRKRIVNTVFFLFHLCFGGSTDFDNRYASGKFCQALLQFLFVIIGRCCLHLVLDLVDSCIYHLFGTGTVYDNRIVFVYDDTGSLTQVLNACRLECASNLFGNYLSACKNGNILKHRFAAVTESRSFYSRYV